LNIFLATYKEYGHIIRIQRGHKHDVPPSYLGKQAVSGGILEDLSDGFDGENKVEGREGVALEKPSAVLDGGELRTTLEEAETSNATIQF
jgi:hypothetical protein